MNLIDRDSLIRKLRSYNGEGFKIQYVVKNIIKILEAEPTVNQWTPCKERLPKEHEEVYVTLINYTGERMTSVDVFENGKFYHHSKNVIAWMPLPPKYEG